MKKVVLVNKHLENENLLDEIKKFFENDSLGIVLYHKRYELTALIITDTVNYSGKKVDWLFTEAVNDLNSEDILNEFDNHSNVICIGNSSSLTAIKFSLGTKYVGIEPFPVLYTGNIQKFILSPK